MKKQITLLSLLISSLSTCFAQPTITYAGVSPQTGVNIITHNGSYQSQGNAGANQTWNFASYSGPTAITTNAITPAGTPYAGQYPTATVCHHIAPQSTYAYLETNSTALYELGAEGPSFSMDGNVDTKIIMQYPLTYTNTWTDNYEVDGLTTGSFTRTGTINANADAYGTLITPNGTYSNTLRIHITEAFSDDFGFTTFSGTLDYYVWYKEGVHYPIFLTAQSTYNGSPYTSYGYYSDAPSGLDEQTGAEAIMVYPTLANEQLYIELGNNFSGDVNYDLTDITGRKILRGEISQQINTINVQDIPAGHYLLRIFSDEAVQTRKVMIQ